MTVTTAAYSADRGALARTATLARDLVEHRADRVLELADRATHDQDVSHEGHQHRDREDRGEDRDQEPGADPGVHALMLQKVVGGNDAQGTASDAVAAGEELPDVPVVLQQEVELDDVVDRE